MVDALATKVCDNLVHAFFAVPVILKMQFAVESELEYHLLFLPFGQTVIDGEQKLILSLTDEDQHFGEDV